MVSKILRVAGALTVTVALSLLAIELLARGNNARERRKRAALGDSLYARVNGDGGRPVIFIAGLQATSSYWGTSFDSLSDHHRLIYLDLLGFGNSPWPEADYNLADQIGAIERTLAQMEATEEVTLVAHSFGTIVAAHYAATHPGEVRQIVLLGAPVFANEKEARERI